MCCIFLLHKQSKEIDHAKDIDLVMPIYNVMEYSDNYLKTSGNLWQYYRDESSLTDADAIQDFTSANQSNKSFKFKQKINSGMKNVEIMVPLKYLSNFWRTTEMLLIVKLALK